MSAGKYVPAQKRSSAWLFFLVVLRAGCSIFRPASSAVVGFSDQSFSLDLGQRAPQLLCGR